jgi:hypothetical protein
MLRRTPLARGKPLQASKPLERKTGLAQVGRKRREAAEAAGKPVKPSLTTRYRPAVPADVRAALVARSGGWCEMTLNGCSGQATDPAHRIGVGAGGRFGEAKVENDRLSNLLYACRTCHDWTHARDDESKDLGLRLERHQIPTQEPVVYRGVLSYLTDDGLVIPFEEVGP